MQKASMTTSVDIVEIASILATRALIEESDMISIVPLNVAQHYANYGMIAMEKLGIITRGKKYLSPATRGFLRCPRESILKSKAAR